MNTRSRAASQTTVSVESAPKPKKVRSESKSAKKPSTDALVTDIISSIKQDNSAIPEPANGTDLVKPAAQKKVQTVKPVRGIAKSGRPWKDVKQKFAKVKKSIRGKPFEKKEKLRHDLKHIKELSRTIKEDKKQDNLAKKQRRAENAQRRLENERKSEIVQVIKNPAKLKRMKKKALRKIEKRDFDAGNMPKVV